MTSHRRTFVAVAVLLVGVVGTTVARPGRAHACSCAIPDLVEEIRDAHTIVSGRVVDSVDLSIPGERFVRRWLVEVTDRFRGDTPAVIEIRLDEDLGGCSDTVTSLPGVLFLGPPAGDGSYRYPECAAITSPYDLEPYVDQVWSADSRSPPTMIAAAATRDHSLAVLDDHGDAVAYLPTSGPTLALAMCPGATHFLQLRSTGWTGGTAELVRWELGDWGEIDAVALPGIPTDSVGARAVMLTCTAADGSTAYLTGPSAWTIDDGVVAPSSLDDQIVAPGPDATALVYGRSLTLAPADPNGPYIELGWDLWSNASSVTMRADGWTVASVAGSPSAAGGTGVELRSIDIGIDGSVTPVPTIPIRFAIWPSVAVAIGRDIAPPPGSGTPLPLLERTGMLVDAPLPTLPTRPSAAPLATDEAVASGGPQASTDPTAVESSGSDDAAGDHDAGASIEWVLGGAVALVLIGGVVVVGRRRARASR